jgi:protein SCO1
MPTLPSCRLSVAGGCMALAVLALGWPSAGRAAGEHSHHQHHDAAAGAATESLSRRVVQVRIPDVAVQQHDGRKLRLAQQLQGDTPVLLNFIYTSCTAICPPMTQILAHTQQLLGGQTQQQVRMISVSLDPERDTAARMAEFAGRFAAGRQWQFDTGSQATSEAIQRAFGVYNPDLMSHTPTTFVRARGATQWVRLDGFATAAQLIQEAMGGH